MRARHILTNARDVGLVNGLPFSFKDDLRRAGQVGQAVYILRVHSSGVSLCWRFLPSRYVRRYRRLTPSIPQSPRLFRTRYTNTCARVVRPVLSPPFRRLCFDRPRNILRDSLMKTYNLNRPIFPNLHRGISVTLIPHSRSRLWRPQCSVSTCGRYRRVKFIPARFVPIRRRQVSN